PQRPVAPAEASLRGPPDARTARLDPPLAGELPAAFGRGGTAGLPGDRVGPPADHRAHLPDPAAQSARGPCPRLVAGPEDAYRPQGLPPPGTEGAPAQDHRRPGP